MPINARKILITDDFQIILAEKNSQGIWKNIDLLLNNIIELNSIDSPVASICLEGFKQSYVIYEKELELFGFDFIEYDRNSTDKSKRSIRQIGELWSFLSGNPSPSQFDGMLNNVKHIKDVVLDQVKESNSVEKIVKQDHTAIAKINAKVDLLFSEENFMEIEINKTEATLKNEIQAAGLCSYGNSLVNIINWEFIELRNIVQDSKFNFANLKMFPPNRVLDILKTSENGRFANYAKFRKSDLFELYRVNSANTVISGPKIISALSVPYVNEGDMENSYDFLIPSSYNMRLDPLMKKAGKKIDLCICSNYSRNMKLFSSDDLVKCQHGVSKTTYICKQRNILLFSNPDSCSKKILPKIIVFQISEIEFLIEKSGETQIICNDVLLKSINVNQTSIVTVPENCFAKNLNFQINPDPSHVLNSNKIHTILELAEAEGSKIKVKEIGSMNDHIQNNFTEIKSKLARIAEVVEKNKETKLDFEKEHEKTMTDAASARAVHGATMGVTFGGSLFIMILFAIIIIGIYKYFSNKKSKKSHVSVNINNIESNDTNDTNDAEKDNIPPDNDKDDETWVEK